MLVRWMQRLAILAGLLVALCVLDSTFQPPAVDVPSEPLRRFTLTAQVLPGELEAGHGFQLTVLKQLGSTTQKSSYQVETSHAGRAGESVDFQIEEGSYWLIVRAEGAARLAQQVRLRRNEKVSLSLLASRSLSVRVLAEAEERLQPLAGATILVGEPGALPQGEASDQEGEAQFNALGVAPWHVRIFAPGYESYEASIESDLVVQLKPVSTLNVTVRNGSLVVPGAEVVIAGVNLWPTRRVVTGSKGRVEISGLKAGRYSLYATHGDLVSPVRRDVELLSRRGGVDVELKLAPGRFVEAVVVDDGEDKPIEGARVTWSSGGLGQFAHHGMSQSSGLVRLGPLAEPGGHLSVQAFGFVPELVGVEPAVGDEMVSHQMLRLKKAASISGRVVDEAGFPVAGATLEAVGTSEGGLPISVTFRSEAVTEAHFDWANDWSRNPSNVLIPIGELGVMLGPVPPIPLGDVTASPGQSLTTNETGYFKIQGVPPGEVVVLARHPEKLDGRSEVIRLAVGQQASTEIVLGEGRRLRGRVLDHRDFPVEMARVRVSGRRFDKRISVESDGSFQLQAAPEEVSLRVSSLEDPLRVLLAVDVQGKKRDEEVVLKLPQPRAVSVVTVVDEQGDPLELAQIHVSSLERQFPLKQTKFSDVRGQVEFPQSADLKVRLRIRAPGYVERSVERRLKGEQELSLTRALSAHGRITQARGRMAAPGATVVVRAGTLVKSTVSDELGEYRFTGLPPGQMTISASQPELGKGRLALSLKAPTRGREAEFPDVDLLATLEVSGRVVDSDGSAVVGALISSTRLSAYLPTSGASQVLGRSEDDGAFRVAVERTAPLYLYASLPGRLFGWSDVVPETTSDRVSDVRILLDQKDVVLPNALGTLLATLEEREGQVVIYAVADVSQAASAGLRAEDVLLEVEGTQINSVDDARELLSGLPGSDLRLVVERGGRPLEVLTSREPFLR